jgi:hypothetical protein
VEIDQEVSALATVEDDRTASDAPAPEPDEPATGGAQRPPWRVIATRVLTGLAAVVVFAGLAMPDRLSRLTPAVFLRIPVEALVALALLLVLPLKPRRIVAAVIGVFVGLVTIAKIFDMGFFTTLDRPFDPYSDWGFLPSAVDYLDRTYGKVPSILAVIGAIVTSIAVLTAMALAGLRLAAVAVRHRAWTWRVVAALTVVWVALAFAGVQIVGGEPVASSSAVGQTIAEVRQVRSDVDDQRTFVDHFANDPYANTPPNQMLTALTGKNVLLTFVESYGRMAIQNSDISGPIDALLDAGTASLKAAGFSARSAFLTSSTAGGGSWLAHSTLQSGLWINSLTRYNELTASHRLTLATAFKKAGWQTEGILPANRYDWPEGAFYGYDKIIDSRNIGYKGPTYSFQSIPDQFTMAAVHSQIQDSTTGPLFAEIDLLSSHAPWEPVPNLVNWNSITDGKNFTGEEGNGDPTDTVFKQTQSKVKADYAETIRYSLTTVIQYLETYGDNNTVMIFLGDHEPAPVVTGEGADRDVPITIVAKDPSVLDRISSWGWQDGLRPNPDAPTWKMDTFRDKFLRAFGSQPSQ